MFKNCFCILFLIFTYNLLIILLTIIIFYDIHISIFNFIKEKKKYFKINVFQPIWMYGATQCILKSTS